MQRRFESDPLFQATDAAAAGAHPQGRPRSIRTPPRCPSCAPAAGGAETPVRVFTDPNTPTPEVQLLSNGRYHVMVTNAGGGYSRWNDLAVTRWREDTTRDYWGTFCYLRDVASGDVLVDRVSADARAGRTVTRRSSPRPAPSSAAATRDFDTHTEIAVSPEDDIELRRVTHHQPLAQRAGPSRSPAMPRSCCAPPRPTRCIRRSATCSCRPRSCASGRRSSARAGRVRATSSRRGCST